MSRRKKRNSFVGDAWVGLLGEEYINYLPKVIDYALENVKENYVIDNVAQIDLPTENIKIKLLTDNRLTIYYENKIHSDFHFAFQLNVRAFFSKL